MFLDNCAFKSPVFNALINSQCSEGLGTSPNVSISWISDLLRSVGRRLLPAFASRARGGAEPGAGGAAPSAPSRPPENPGARTPSARAPRRRP